MALVIPLVVSCSDEPEEICKAELCVEVAWICENDKQVSLTILGGSISSSVLYVDVVREEDTGSTQAIPITVQPGSKEVVLAEGVRGVSGHPVTMRIKVRSKPTDTPLEVRSATLDPGEECPQSA